MDKPMKKPILIKNKDSWEFFSESGYKLFGNDKTYVMHKYHFKYYPKEKILTLNLNIYNKDGTEIPEDRKRKVYEVFDDFLDYTDIFWPTDLDREYYFTSPIKDNKVATLEEFQNATYTCEGIVLDKPEGLYDTCYQLDLEWWMSDTRTWILECKWK